MKTPRTETGKKWNSLCNASKQQLADRFFAEVLKRKLPLKFIVHWILTQAFTAGMLHGLKMGAANHYALQDLVRDLAENGMEIEETAEGFTITTPEHVAAAARKVIGLPE
jgi:hypothetical protein